MTVAAEHRYQLEHDEQAARVELDVRELEAGVDLVTLRWQAQSPSRPTPVRLVWDEPCVDMLGSWWTGGPTDRGISNWTGPAKVASRSTSEAPVIALYNAASRNRCTFACSDALNDVAMQAVVVEETATIRCEVALFTEAMPPIEQYEASVRIDRRDVVFADALDAVRAWWETFELYEPSPPPDVAKRPMYSTWYSFHQSMTEDQLAGQCELAKPLGMDAIIIDDGWQTLDANRGYPYVGDWKPERLTQMRDMVDRIHAVGMKVVLWYGAPLVGEKSEAFAKWKHRILHKWRFGAHVLDPRYPDVREFLIGTYEQAMRDWDLDGFKLDFVCRLYNVEGQSHAPGSPGMDHDSVAQASDRLLTDIMARLRAIKPDVLIEFRQPYIGPLMRKYGNMFRAGDCPNDPLANRVRTVGVRLLAGETPTHSDMIMWNPAEPVEQAARHLLAAWFSVPQISMRLDQLPEDHLKMLGHLLGAWSEQRDVLLNGRLLCPHPEGNFPLVSAERDGRRVTVVYGPAVAPWGDAPAGEALWNAGGEASVVLRVARATQAVAHDCCGRPIGPAQPVSPGLADVRVPVGGYLIGS